MMPTHSPMLGPRKAIHHVGPVHLAEHGAAGALLDGSRMDAQRRHDVVGVARGHLHHALEASGRANAGAACRDGWWSPPAGVLVDHAAVGSARTGSP